MKRISTVWKKLIKRVSSKSTSDESSSSPSSRSMASTSAARSASGKSPAGRRSAGGAQDAKVLQILSDFSKNRNLAEGAGGQQNTMLLLLQREMDFYNADVERRRQKLLEEAQTCVAAVVGRKKASSVRKTDDALPYIPKRIDWSEIAKVAAKKAAAPPPKQPQVTAPAREKSVKEKAPAPVAQTTTTTPQPAKASEPSTQTAPLPEKHVEPAAPSAPTTPPPPVPPQPQVSSAEQHSESSSSSESSTTETAGQLTNVIAQIVQDAQNPERAKQHEELRQTSIDDMIKMSRNDPDTFDRIISENTKDSLFVTQPTHDEWRAWQGSGGGQIRAKSWTDEIDLSDAHVSSQTFCCSNSCNKPRHPNYPYFKKSA